MAGLPLDSMAAAALSQAGCVQYMYTPNSLLQLLQGCLQDYTWASAALKGFKHDWRSCSKHRLTDEPDEPILICSCMHGCAGIRQAFLKRQGRAAT